MKIPSAQTLLSVWEHGRTLPRLERIVLLMQWLFPEQSPETWPIGKRDENLFRLRQRLFGDTIPCYDRCPNCEEQIEFDLSSEQIITNSPPIADSLTVEVDSETIEFRLPNTRDLLESADATMLIGRCLVSDYAITDKGRTQIAAQIAQADPLANLQIKSACPSCQHIWSTPFDIASYIWTDIDRWAHITLQTVHILARAYSWTETDILQMSAWRRHYYLRLLNG